MPRKDNRPAFGCGTPSVNLKLAQEGNITSVELLAFFPEGLRSYDPVLRLVQNGMDQSIAANVINYNLEWEKWPVEDNTVCKMIEKTMRTHSGKKKDKWTVSSHRKNKWTYDFKADDDDLTLTGHRVQCEIDEKYGKNGRHLNPVIDDMFFRDLAIGIARYPSISQGDGLDLTQRVKYAASHPEEDLIYPRDFVSLTTRLGGPLPMRPEHTDKEALRRWKQNRDRDDEDVSDDEDVDEADLPDNRHTLPSHGGSNFLADLYDGHNMFGYEAEGHGDEFDEQLGASPVEYSFTPEEYFEAGSPQLRIASPYTMTHAPQWDGGTATSLYERVLGTHRHDFGNATHVGFHQPSHLSATEADNITYATGLFSMDANSTIVQQPGDYIVSSFLHAPNKMSYVSGNIDHDMEDAFSESTEDLSPHTTFSVFDDTGSGFLHGGSSSSPPTSGSVAPTAGTSATIQISSPMELAMFDDLPSPFDHGDLRGSEDSEAARY